MSTQMIPMPRCELSIRVATLADVAFIDALQKKHAKMVGFMQKAALEGKINAGHVLVAWASRPCSSDEDNTGETPVPLERLGYVIAQDRYFKRDDVGVIYQLNVMPNAHRKLIGAMLIKAVFERAAYGCKLFCCWCAQDLEANYFWESVGFIPLAFRTGARGKQRIHIFWQRRIREGDTTTPYWFPSKTDSGSMREDRLVLPIPPGTHWRDAMPVLLPVSRSCQPRLEDQKHGLAARDTKRKRVGKTTATVDARSKALTGVFFAPAVDAKAVVEKPRRQPKPARAKVKFAPEHVAAARELRDRYLEQFNSGLVLPARAQGKYDVCRQIETAVTAARGTPLLLEQAMQRA